MGLKEIWKRSRLREKWHGGLFYNDYLRIRRLYKRNGWGGIRFLLPGRLWLDSLEVVVTTKCNLRCPDCANLMQYYEEPYHVDLDMVVASMRKLDAVLDWCDEYKILGGEPFLYPDLAEVLEAVPREKCGKVHLVTNGTVIPKDPALFDVLRRKRINVFISNYPAAQETQKRLIDTLIRENISWSVAKTSTWIDHGTVTDYGAGTEERQRQFMRCYTLFAFKSLLNGCLYYCARSGHGQDLGLIARKPGEYVDVLHNTDAQNRRQIRRLMWRRRPIEACKYCLRGTDKAVKIPRGK